MEGLINELKKISLSYKNLSDDLDHRKDNGIYKDYDDAYCDGKSTAYWNAHCIIDKLIWKYGNDENEIENAKKLLKSNGYIVKKWTRSMERDANECVEMDEHGESKDCCGCSCSVCLMQ